MQKQGNIFQPLCGLQQRQKISPCFPKQNIIFSIDSYKKTGGSFGSVNSTIELFRPCLLNFAFMQNATNMFLTKGKTQLLLLFLMIIFLPPVKGQLETDHWETVFYYDTLFRYSISNAGEPSEGPDTPATGMTG
jgi:hypothetical protein